MNHPKRGGPRPGFRKPTNKERGLPPPKVVTTVRLPVDVIDYLDQIKRQLKQSRSVTIELTLREKMSRG